jgi:aconitate hydratase
MRSQIFKIGLKNKIINNNLYIENPYLNEKSFARIHETNLKKQGILALTFVKSDDYNIIREDDRIDIPGLEKLAPESKLVLKLTHSDQTKDYLEASHSYNENQISWFKAGSALNLIRKSR